MNRKFSQRIGVLLLTVLSASDNAQAHFPWLASDSDGHAVMWFGESMDDRSYPMPAPVQALEIHGEQSDAPLEMKPIESSDLVGIRSTSPIDESGEIAGQVTYGIYHGSKLTYHVEHMIQPDPSRWPSDAREDAPLQTIIQAEPDGGVHVTVLHRGNPLTSTEVRLLSEDGSAKASLNTNESGTVSFTKDILQPGLNALIVGLTNQDAEGTFDGSDYASTTDYLTTTFQIPEIAEPKIDPQSGASIEPSGLPDLPEELTSFGAAITSDTVFVYGGHTGSAHSYSTDEQSDRFWSLNLKSPGSWQPLPGGPKLQGLALVADGDRLIRIGGFTAVNAAGEEHDLRSQASVASFDIATNQWHELADLPEARSSLDAATLNGRVYVFGGWKLDGENESQWHQSAWSLDLENPSATWQAVAKPPFKRRAICIAAFDGKLYVIGGMTSKGKPTTQTDIYDVKTDSWTKGPAIPGKGMSGFGSSAFATGGKLYVTTMDGFVHRLSSDSQSWKTIAKSDPARFFHRMLPENDHTLLMIGGANMEIGKFTRIDRIHTK